MARTWADGRGGQCTKSRVAPDKVPVGGSCDFCGHHNQFLKDGKLLLMGRVDGPIPDQKKLVEFERAAARRSCKPATT